MCVRFPQQIRNEREIRSKEKVYCCWTRIIWVNKLTFLVQCTSPGFGEEAEELKLCTNNNFHKFHVHEHTSARVDIKSFVWTFQSSPILIRLGYSICTTFYYRLPRRLCLCNLYMLIVRSHDGNDKFMFNHQHKKPRSHSHVKFSKSETWTFARWKEEPWNVRKGGGRDEKSWKIFRESLQVNRKKKSFSIPFIRARM